MLTPSDRRTILGAQHRKIEKFLQSMPADHWFSQSMCEAWTVADVVAHFTGNNFNHSDWIVDALQSDKVGSLEPRQLKKTRIDASAAVDQVIAFREELGERLLEEYVRSNRSMEHALGAVGDGDWDKLCYRPIGSEPIRNLMDAHIAEASVHLWDIAFPFDTGFKLPEEGLTVIVERYPHRPRWWKVDLSGQHPPLPARFRLRATNAEAPGTDFVIESDADQYMEVANKATADVSFTCDAETFVLMCYGRVTPASLESSGELSWSGDADWAPVFINGYVGG
jgi:uncharacterized protein (TIGR03083 family)